MKAEISIENHKFEIDFSKGNDLSIPILFNGKQPNTYKVPHATKPYKDGQFIGDTRMGGSVIRDLYHHSSL